MSDSVRRRIIQMISSLGLNGTKLFVMRKLFRRAIDTTSIRRAFESVSATTNGWLC